MKKLPLLLGAIFLCAFTFSACSSSPAAKAPSVAEEKWGQLADDLPVSLYTLENANGMRVKISNFGALIVAVEVPDKNGDFADVALGYNTLAEYQQDTATYFGAVVGRVANRIAHGQFSLAGKTYTLPTNNAPADIPCTLHGGKVGFDKKLWQARVLHGENPTLALTYLSKDGEEGFPGNLSVTVTYTLLANNTLRVHYAATTDQPTPVNLSQHSYFNLSGEGSASILDHQLRIPSAKITPVTAGLIPTGEFLPVAGTPFDFNEPHAIGERIDADHEQLHLGAGYDHNWVLQRPLIKKFADLQLAAELSDPASGRVLRLYTDQPGIQFYSGNFLDGTLRGKSGKAYARRSALALETQHFPDSPNQPNFPSVILQPGEFYDSATEFRFSTR